jgi:hypothetical protein
MSTKDSEQKIRGGHSKRNYRTEDEELTHSIEIVIPFLVSSQHRPSHPISHTRGRLWLIWNHREEPFGTTAADYMPCG